MPTLRDFTDYLHTVSYLDFKLPDGRTIPAHFHITELALLDKRYIDCGWTKRHEQIITMQIWLAWDTDHRLTAEKLWKIIELSRSIICTDTLPLIFEYQGETIQSRSRKIQGASIHLTPLFTNCLAMNKCGISPDQIACCGGGMC